MLLITIFLEKKKNIFVQFGGPDCVNGCRRVAESVAGETGAVEVKKEEKRSSYILNKSF
jgi:hypothetical protein